MLSCFWANKIDFVNFLSQFSMIGYTAQFYNKTANIVIFLLFSWALSYVRTITRSHGIGVTSVVRETPQVNGRRQSYPSHYTHTPTDMSPNIAYVITSTIYSHATFGQDRPRSYFSPYSQSCHPIFFIYFFVRKIFPQTLSSGRWTDFDMRYTSRRVFTQGSAFWGLKQYFHIFTLKIKKTFLRTYNGKPMANFYSHNCMMHRYTMLKFDAMFDVAKYLGHTQKCQRTRYGRGLVAPH